MPALLAGECARIKRCRRRPFRVLKLSGTGIRPPFSPPLVAALSSELLDRGKRALFLTTDVTNPTSNAVYARIGCRPLSDQYQFDFVGGTGSDG